MTVIRKSKNFQSIKWIYNNSKYVLARIIFLSLCTIAISYISVEFAIVSKQLLDFATKAVQGDIKQPIIKLIILVFIQLIIQLVYTMVNLHTETDLKNSLQRNLFNEILHKKLPDINKYHSGELLNRLNNDLGTVTSGVMSLVPCIVSFASKILIGLVALYRLDSSFALIFLVVGPFIMFVAKLYSKKIKPLHKQCQQNRGKVHSFMLESIRNVLVIKSFGVYDRVWENTQKLQNKFLKVVMKRGYLSIFANILFYISLTIGYYFAVGWCAYKISIGIMTVGTFTAILQLVGQVQTPFKELANVTTQIFAVTASAERVMEIESLPDESGRYTNISCDDIYNRMKCIRVKDLSFSYDDEVIFDKASVSIQKNTLSAISGISGIGKSTLLKLLLGILEPASGELSMECDDASYTLDASFRPLFAYVPQGNMILSGTVCENIAFMSDNINKEKIEEAATIACIYDFISELPDGFDTVLGEGGSGLSEGQIQRIAVARAIYSGAPVLLLDEATSALDDVTERKMLENIKSLQNRTCIIISHKECALKMSDSIISIKNGKISCSFNQPM